MLSDTLPISCPPKSMALKLSFPMVRSSTSDTRNTHTHTFHDDGNQRKTIVLKRTLIKQSFMFTDDHDGIVQA